MEEVDQIILNSLLNVGCDFAEGMESLKQMTTENVVEGTVKCLKIINSDFKMSHLFPPGMSARFRVGTSLANACRNAGYRGDVGYQTFLYSSETDIRKIFMFLVEKLPRKEGITEDSGSSSVLQKRIGQLLREQCSILWLPPYCSEKRGYAGMPFRTQNLIIPNAKDKNSDKVPFVHMQVEPGVLVPSILELNANQLGSSYLASDKSGSQKKKTASKAAFQWKQKSTVVEKLPVSSSFEQVIQWVTGSSSQGKQSRFAHAQQLQFTQVPSSLVRARPNIPQKPEHLKRKVQTEKSSNHEANQTEGIADAVDSSQQDVPEEGKDVVAETEEERFYREEEELKEIIASHESDRVNFQEQLRTMEASIKQMQIEVLALEESVAGAEKNIDVQEKTVFLLPNAEENMEKLQKLIDKNSQRLVTLGKMWEERRVPLINDIRELKQKSDTSENNAEMKLEELKLIRRRMKEASEETKRKEQMIKQLTSELDSMKRDVSRQSYTKRILEIVSSIHKQQQEIERVIDETKAVQKQMNKMKGRIDRTFTAVDEAMFKDAKRDENIRQAYKYLVSLHDGCTDLIRTVEDTGAIMREIRELEEQIEIELKKKSEENLSKILKDFKQMKSENTELIKRLKNQ